jgi:serine/threonine protein kinase/flagellar motility protein MotE (MotC chaperone)
VSRRPEAQPSEPGQILNNRFRLVKKLGTGGMGSVWLAEDEWLERPVALKELARTSGGDAIRNERRRRVRLEARALARVRHPAIVPIHDLFFAGDDPWIVMEYISGRSLAEVISGGPLDALSIARIGLQVLRGLTAMHGAGIVHRDVKPANIVVADEGSVWLVDLGIAKITGDPSLTGYATVMGTLEYMSPERLMPGAKVGAPADIWALGVTCFYALEGYSPFHPDADFDQEAIMLAIAQETPKPTRHDPLGDLTLRMLVKDPQERAKAAEVLRGFEWILRGTATSRASGRSRVAEGTVPRGKQARPSPALESAAVAPAPSGPPSRRHHEHGGQSTRQAHDSQSTRYADIRAEIMRVGADTGAAMLLKMDVRTGAKILAECPARNRGELLQAMAAVQPGTAATILRMMFDSTAGQAFAYLLPPTAVSLLAAMPTPEAVRILGSTDPRAAASTIMELSPAEAAGLLGAMADKERAAKVLAHATARTAVAVARADLDLARDVVMYLPEPHRTQVKQALSGVA